jgi:hypothetical protein
LCFARLILKFILSISPATLSPHGCWPIDESNSCVEVSMKKQMIAGAIALMLGAGMTTSAMAFGHGGGGGHFGGGGGHFGGGHFGGGHFGGGHFGGGHIGGFGGHAAGFGGMHGGFGGGRLAGVRGYDGGWHHGWGGRRLGYGYGGYGYGGYYDSYAADVGLFGLGLGLAEAATGTCDPYAGYDCGYGYGAPVVTWGW